MKHVLRFTLALLALVALAVAMPGAQSAAQKPPDPKAADQAPAAATQKPAETPQELPDEAKAFNTAMAEKNPLKRVELLEKYIADNPKATAMLLSMARSNVQTSLLAALKDVSARYQKVIDTELEDGEEDHRHAAAVHDVQQHRVAARHRRRLLGRGRGHGPQGAGGHGREDLLREPQEDVRPLPGGLREAGGQLEGRQVHRAASGALRRRRRPAPAGARGGGAGAAAASARTTASRRRTASRRPASPRRDRRRRRRPRRRLLVLRRSRRCRPRRRCARRSGPSARPRRRRSARS